MLQTVNVATFLAAVFCWLWRLSQALTHFSLKIPVQQPEIVEKFGCPVIRLYREPLAV